MPNLLWPSLFWGPWVGLEGETVPFPSAPPPGLGDCRAKQQLSHTGNSLEVPWGCGCTWGGALSLLMGGPYPSPPGGCASFPTFHCARPI